MKELLLEQLKEYTEKLEHNRAACLDLMKRGKPWEELAKEGAGYQQLRDACILELKKYS